MNKKLRCHSCRKVLGVLKKDLIEIKCPRCGEVNLVDLSAGKVLAKDPKKGR